MRISGQADTWPITAKYNVERYVFQARPTSPPTSLGGSPALGAKQQAGWGFQILPYLEGENVWRAGPVLAIGTPNKVFFCPSRRGPRR